jgi:hypothetical protein
LQSTNQFVAVNQNHTPNFHSVPQLSLLVHSSPSSPPCFFLLYSSESKERATRVECSLSPYTSRLGGGSTECEKGWYQRNNKKKKKSVSSRYQFTLSVEISGIIN